MSDAFQPDLGPLAPETLPVARGQPGYQPPAQPQRQAHNEAYIPSMRNRPYSQWGDPDFAMQGAQNYPGMSPGPFMPQISDFPGLIHGLTMGLGRYGSRHVGMPAIAMGTYATAFLNAYNKGLKERAAQNYQQYRQAREMMVDRLEDEQRSYKDVYSAYHDQDGNITDPTAFNQAILAVADKYQDDPVRNAIRSGNSGMVDRILQGRDGHLNDARKMKLQEDRQKQEDESRRLEIEIRKGELKRQQDEEEASRKFLQPGSSAPGSTTTGSPPTPETPGGITPLSPVSPSVESAAQEAQMGGKPALPKTAAAEQAVNARKAELDKYMRGLTDPNSAVPPDQILPLVRRANPRMADEVQNLLDGAGATAAEAGKDPALQIAMNLAKKIDPNYTRTAELRKEQAAQMGQRAEISVLRNDLTKQMQIYSRFRETLGKNIQDMDYLLELAKNMQKNGIETGSPVIDRWIRAGRQDIAGDPEVSNFNTQLELFRSDAGQLLRSNQGSGVYTVYAQREMEKLLQPGINKAQLEGTVNLFKRDYEFRMKPIVKEINRLNAEMAKIAGIKPPSPMSEDIFSDINLPPRGSPVSIPPMPTYRELK
jgi:hypothetical protein